MDLAILERRKRKQGTLDHLSEQLLNANSRVMFRIELVVSMWIYDKLVSNLENVKKWSFKKYLINSQIKVTRDNPQLTVELQPWNPWIDQFVHVEVFYCQYYVL